ncbi:MAG: alpha/beta fold hydrolase [Bacteroidota bacterium]
MKCKKPLFIVLFSLSIFGFTQNLNLEPYIFISKAGDSIDAEIGSFKVPEDRTESHSDSITVKFIRFKSTNPNPESPIVYLSGGPGGSGSETAKGRRFDLFMKLREVADVIAFDQRGTGLSNRLPNCKERAYFELDKPIERQIYIEKTTSNIKKCFKFWSQKNVNLKAYNTTESAKDIEELRKLLNTKQISLWGISYGSHLAFEYVSLFENSLDKVVLASLEGKDQTIKLPKNTEDFVFKLAEMAKTNAGSDDKYPDLKAKIIEVHERVKANPVIATYKNRRGGIDTIGISNFELQSAIATFYLKNPSDQKKLPKLYLDMYKGNFSEVAVDVMVMKRYIYPGVRPMPFAMDMQSGISEQRKILVANQISESILGSSINFLLYEWMTSLEFPQLSNDFRIMKPNKVDALLFSGTLDGRTYLKAGKAIANKFENGRHIPVVNGGHDLFMASPKIGETILEFFKGKSIDTTEIVVEPLVFN